MMMIGEKMMNKTIKKYLKRIEKRRKLDMVVNNTQKQITQTKKQEPKKEEFDPKYNIILSKDIIAKLLLCHFKITDREVGGLFIGKTNPSENILYLKELVILNQVGNGGSVEISGEDIATFLTENITLFDGGYRIAGWWHTHPNMSTSQSYQDKTNNKEMMKWSLSSKQTNIMVSIITTLKAPSVPVTTLGKLFREAPETLYYTISAHNIDFSAYVFLGAEGYYFEEETTKIMAEKGSPYSMKDITEDFQKTFFEDLEKKTTEKVVVQTPTTNQRYTPYGNYYTPSKDYDKLPKMSFRKFMKKNQIADMNVAYYSSFLCPAHKWCPYHVCKRGYLTGTNKHVLIKDLCNFVFNCGISDVIRANQKALGKLTNEDVKTILEMELDREEEDKALEKAEKEALEKELKEETQELYDIMASQEEKRKNQPLNNWDLVDDE